MADERRYAWLWLVVMLQVAIPASYYVRGSAQDDERFAWRMFSGVRLKRCVASARSTADDGKLHSVALRGALHGSWIHAIERGRERVIERFLASRCGSGIVRVSLERRCEAVGENQPSELAVYDYDCAKQSLHTAPGAPR